MIGIYFSRFHSCVVLVEIWKNTYRFGALKNIFSQFCHIYWHNLQYSWKFYLIFPEPKRICEITDLQPALFSSPSTSKLVLILAAWRRAFPRRRLRSTLPSTPSPHHWLPPSSRKRNCFTTSLQKFQEIVENVRLLLPLWKMSPCLSHCETSPPPPILLRELWFGPRNDARQPIFFL